MQTKVPRKAAWGISATQSSLRTAAGPPAGGVEVEEPERQPQHHYDPGSADLERAKSPFSVQRAFGPGRLYVIDY